MYDLERIVRNIASKLSREFPDIELDELVSEGYIIAVEAMEKYNPKLASESTFIYGQVSGRLRNYANRVLTDHLKVDLDHAKHLFVEDDRTSVILDQIERRIDGENLKTFKLLREGKNHREAAEILGVSTATVGNRFRKIKDMI